MDEFFKLNKGQPKEIKNAVQKGKDTAVFYVAQNNRCHIAANLEKRFLYVVGDIVEGKKVYDRLLSYGDGNYALMPEKEDVLMRRQNAAYRTLGERLRILLGMADGTIDGVVVTCETLLNKFPSKKRLEENCVYLLVGEETKYDEFVKKLTEIGYKRVTEVEKTGEYRVQGDVVEIFPLNEELPLRISFFGDEVEEIRSFSVETHVSAAKREDALILPATEFTVREEELQPVLSAIKKASKNADPEAKKVVGEYAEELMRAPSDHKNTYFLPFLPETASLYDYADDFVIVLDDIRQAEDKIKLTRKAFENRLDALVEGFSYLPWHEDLLWTYEDVKSPKQTTLGFGRITSAVNFFVPKEIFTLQTTALPPYYNDMEGFFSTLKQMLVQKVKIRIYVAGESAKKAMTDALADHDIGAEDGFGEGDLCIGIGNVEYGFFYPREKILCVGYGDISKKSAAPKKSNERKRVVFELPEKGDYVVHEFHGIGICNGMVKLNTPYGEKDFLAITYKGGDTLYVHPEQLSTVEKYSGADHPKLNAIGGAEFERVKERVRKSVKSMALDLLDVYKARYNARGYRYQPDTPWQKEMEDDFEFTETDDQLVAINEIKEDMESGKVMDRLLCGDVGFGKTEVAIRAIFKTIIEGKQAAILSPTTILSQQHYNVICARLNKFKFNIVLLNRFVPPSEIKKSLEMIKSGKADVVVATHRLLSKDVVFHDLGLLVLDEEQRFGVEHKEKLKAIRKDVNVLSLSATPIPRTLHMALSGIRDISTLETPPKNRLPVETYVTEYNDDLLKTAIEKELSRGGQAFILFNRVAGIEKFYEHTKELLGDEARVVYAHGQMDEETLEDAIKKFYDGEADVLISTTIIENGIDLPSANTLFVIDADRLGLSQLYQLRGRVGRSDNLAYAYFTVREKKVLTESAVKRLDALMANTELGSGFKIAMRDLEIRGAGNILGREQSGQMERVGYELYLKLVKEGIDEAQGKTVGKEVEPELKIEGYNGLRDSYISDAKTKIAVYKSVSALQSTKEGEEYYKYLSEKYGTSVDLKDLIRVAVLRSCAKKARVRKVVVDRAETKVYFTDSECLRSESTFKALEAFKDTAVLTPATPPVVSFKDVNRPLRKRIKEVKDFLETLTQEE